MYKGLYIIMVHLYIIQTCFELITETYSGEILLLNSTLVIKWWKGREKKKHFTWKFISWLFGSWCSETLLDIFRAIQNWSFKLEWKI